MAPWNGTGTFDRDQDWTDDRDAGGNQAIVDATKMDDEFDNYKAGLENCVTRDGQNSPSADLPMNAHRHTGVANATARTNYAAAGQIQDAGLISGTVGGTGNAITLTLTPAITAYANNQQFILEIGAANTTAVTLAVSGLTAKNLKKQTLAGKAALVSGDLQAGHRLTVQYDSSDDEFVIVGGPANGLSGTYQPLDATLTALAGLSTGVDKFPYSTGTDAFSQADLTAVARTLLAQNTQALMRTTGLGSTTIGDALFIAASALSARSTLGALGQFKIGVITRDLTAASGAVSTTGIGFNPRLVILLSSMTGNPAFSLGLIDGSNSKGFYQDYTGNSNYQGSDASVANPAAGAVQEGVGALITDGFSLTWTKTGSPTGTFTILYLALGN